MKKVEVNSSTVFKVFNFFVGTVLIVYCVSLMLPLIWTITSSFKGLIDYTQSSYSLPKKWIFTNYSEVFKMLSVTVLTSKGFVRFGIGSMFGISLIKSFSNSAIVLFFTTAVAYVVSKYKFIGKNFIYALGLFVMIMPIIGSFPSLMMISRNLGIYDNLFMFIITSPRCVFGMNFLLLYGAFKSIPWDYAEAAFVDGAGHYRVMFKIMFPMIFQTCVVLFVLGFLGEWNDYETCLIWLPSYPNLAYGMYYFQINASIYEATTPQILAGFVIIMIPTIIMYLSAQKTILSKFNIGGLKG